ncbi:MAG: site-2 protease family protein, partial [Phycisphaerales bacterium]
MLDTVINLPAVILGFGALIFFHELGHFVAAKWAGVRTGAFAVGMGPVLLSWRRGIGLVAGSTQARVVEMTGSPADKLTDEELAHHGLGETEYSLRLLPLGGFVSMLGQEDGKPEAVSDDPRSYNLAPVGKRMVIISAGVVMNLILAIVLFVVAFGIGVKFEAPVIGSTQLGGPAARAGLLPGDT